jgi:hypothetical protein
MIKPNCSVVIQQRAPSGYQTIVRDLLGHKQSRVSHLPKDAGYDTVVYIWRAALPTPVPTFTTSMRATIDGKHYSIVDFEDAGGQGRLFKLLLRSQDAPRHANTSYQSP